MPISLHIPNLVKFYQFVLKILSENEKVKSIKRHNSNLRKITNNNPNLHLVDINGHTKTMCNKPNLDIVYINVIHNLIKKNFYQFVFNIFN